MLTEIDHLGGVEAIPTMVNRAKDKNDSFRLMGFGHRVYKLCGLAGWAAGGWVACPRQHLRQGRQAASRGGL